MTVDAVACSHNRVLLVRRACKPFVGYWALPGGHLDANETAAEAALRELQEETGLTGSSPRLIGIFDDPNRHPRQSVAIAYAVTVPYVPDGDPQTTAQPGEVQEIMWASLTTLDDLHIAFDHRRIIDACLRQNLLY